MGVGCSDLPGRREVVLCPGSPSCVCPRAQKIDPAQTKVEYGSVKADIKLTKADANEQWPSLEKGAA